METADTQSTPTLYKGYLHRDRGVWLLKTVCTRCGRWHTHGAGAGPRPDYEPGQVANRAAHCCCVPVPGYAIAVQAEPYNPSWATITGRFSRTCGVCT